VDGGGMTRLENGVSGLEDLLDGSLGNLLGAEPVLQVAPAELRSGKSKGLAADQCHAFRFDFPDIPGCPLVTIIESVGFGRVAEDDMGEFVEEGAMRGVGDWRDSDQFARGVALGIAIEQTEIGAMNAEDGEGPLLAPFRKLGRVIRLSVGLSQDKPVRLIHEHRAAAGVGRGLPFLLSFVL
jgi:hypothetical protein